MSAQGTSSDIDIVRDPARSGQVAARQQGTLTGHFITKYPGKEQVELKVRMYMRSGDRPCKSLKPVLADFAWTHFTASFHFV